jgi:hypothetical protein
LRVFGKDGEEMEKKYVLVTNNPKADDVYKSNAAIGVEYLTNASYLDVLIRVRDRVYDGWSLMTHPQASNLKPNQCPYKTILISRDREGQDFARDVELIETAISGYHKFTDGMKAPCWGEKALGDFMTVDLSVVESALGSSLMRQMLMRQVENL